MPLADAVYWHDVINAAGWGSLPAAETEWLNSAVSRRSADLSAFTEARFGFYQTSSGFTGSLLYPLYSIDSGSTWNAIDGGTGLEVNFATNGVLKVSSWVSIETDAKTSVWLALFGRGGNASQSPSTRATFLELR